MLLGVITLYRVHESACSVCMSARRGVSVLVESLMLVETARVLEKVVRVILDGELN